RRCPPRRADGEGGAANLPREARVGDGRRSRRALREERPSAPSDPGGDCGPEPAGSSRARPRARPLLGTAARGDPGQGREPDARFVRLAQLHAVAELVQRASVTFERPRGSSGSRPLVRASAQAKSWPGTTESNGARSGEEGAGTERA